MAQEYFIDTNPVDPATLEPVVPEGVEDLLQEESGGCCGGACCQG
ncbi:MAG TPA: hypothetical protein VLZ31_06315 [Microbacteriaceae bacterium]|nr:hypothetical protein [Microbacteriaceae bacterium]